MSTDTGRPVASTTAGTTWAMRAHSSSGGMAVYPGRVDWPPMSMMSAPSRAISRAWATAAWGTQYLPPSEKESGVTFKIPIT